MLSASIKFPLVDVFLNFNFFTLKFIFCFSLQMVNLLKLSLKLLPSELELQFTVSDASFLIMQSLVSGGKLGLPLGQLTFLLR